MFFFITGSSFFPVYIHIYPLSLGSMVSQYLFYQANMLCFQALAPICAMGMSIDKQQQFSQWYVVQFFFFLFLFAHQIVCVGTTQWHPPRGCQPPNGDMTSSTTAVAAT